VKQNANAAISVITLLSAPNKNQKPIIDITINMAPKCAVEVLGLTG
jgi:hypothetical protein